MEVTPNNKKIFLVEDEAFLRDLLSQKLLNAGFEVLPYGSSLDIVSEALEHKPDLILLDIVMPGKNGFDVMDELAQDPETGAIPVMIVSNLNQDDDREKAKTKGAKDYLVKSNHSPSEIVTKVNEMVGLDNE